MEGSGAGCAWRGLLNVGVLLTLVLGLLRPFMFFLVLSYFRCNARNLAIVEIFGLMWGQAPVLFQMSELIDIATRQHPYQFRRPTLLAFAIESRTFYPKDNP